MAELTVSTPGSGQDGSLTLVISGELDIASVPRFVALTACYARASIRRLVMDVSGLTFADVAGLRALDTLRVQSERRNVTVELAGASPHLSRLMTIFRLGAA
jgi:anti-anti-sigma factor